MKTVIIMAIAAILAGSIGHISTLLGYPITKWQFWVFAVPLSAAVGFIAGVFYAQ